jgi:hypothetical protein
MNVAGNWPYLRLAETFALISTNTKLLKATYNRLLIPNHHTVNNRSLAPAAAFLIGGTLRSKS